MNSELDAFSIIVLGALNPPIHHPLWYADARILTPTEAEEAQRSPAFLCTRDAAAFSFGQLQVRCTRSRWSVHAARAEALDRLLNLAAHTHDRLRDTPVTGFGLRACLSGVSSDLTLEPGRSGRCQRHQTVRHAQGRVRPPGFWAAEPPRHQSNHRHIDERLCGVGESLVVFAQASLTIPPAIRTLDYPPPWENLKRVRSRRWTHDFYVDTQIVGRMLNQLPCVSAIRPHLGHRRVGSMHRRQSEAPTISILNICGQHEDHENKPEYVNKNVPLPALDLLPRVVAARSPHLRRLRRLAVNDCSRGLRGSSSSHPYLTTKRIVNSLPRSILLPPAKVTVDQLPLRKIMRKHSPLATGSVDIEDGVEDLTPRMLGRQRRRLRCGDQRFQNLPLFVGEVGRVGFPSAGFHASEPWANLRLNKI
jgi:hypothetical protein